MIEAITNIINIIRVPNIGSSNKINIICALNLQIYWSTSSIAYNISLIRGSTLSNTLPIWRYKIRKSIHIDSACEHIVLSISKIETSISFDSIRAAIIITICIKMIWYPISICVLAITNRKTIYCQSVNL